MTAEDIQVRLLKGKSLEGASRFLGAIQNTGMRYGTIQLPINGWTVDGTEGATITADVGTDGTMQQPSMAFANDSDDIAFNRFYLPLEYSMERGEIWVVLTTDSSNHDNSVFMEWNVEATVIPTTVSTGSTEEYSTNVKMDTSTTSCVVINQYVHETTYLTKSIMANLTDGITPRPGDYILIKVWNDNSDSSVTGAMNIVGACVHYSR